MVIKPLTHNSALQPVSHEASVDHMWRIFFHLQTTHQGDVNKMGLRSLKIINQHLIAASSLLYETSDVKASVAGLFGLYCLQINI